MRTAPLVAAALAALLSATPSPAAEVELKDGRRFTGEVSEDDAGVTIDTKVGSIRARLTFARDEVAKVERTPLPPGFFDEAPAPARAGGSGARGERLYVLVPVDGRFGEQVVATGLGRALSYAVRNHIEHVVLHVNTKDHANFEEGAAAFKVLLRYRDQLKLHALVRSGLGDGLGVIAACHTIHLEPGAKIGGAPDPAPEGVDEAEHEALRRERGRKAERALTGLGRATGGRIVRAMLDPDDALAGWKDDEGMHLGPAVPAGATKVFEVAAGAVLVLDAPALGALGLQTVEGGATGLGAALGVTGWKAEGDFGARAMAAASEEVRTQTARKEAQAAARVARASTRRQEVFDALQHDLQEAAQWDPNKGDYSTYQRTTWWDWGTTSTVDTHQLTADSKARWTQRSDMTIRYLQRALKDIRALQRLEADAAKLGLEPLIPAQALEAMKDDLTAKGRVVAANRERTER